MKNTILFLFTILLTLSLKAQDNKLQASETEALIHVKVTDMEDHIRKNDIILFEGEQTGIKIRGISDNNGRFDILLPEGDTYLIKIAGLGDEEDYSRIRIGDEEGYYEGSIQIKYEPAKTFTLNDVHFDFSKATLRPSSYTTLKEMAEFLKIKQDMRVEIAGHTDNVGDEASNLKLSQQRAAAVVNYLIQQGISANRLQAKGYGESQPIASNESKEGRQQNRRTEARVLDSL